MANIWGYWDCPKCGSKHFRGDIDVCPNCGAPRSLDIRFYVDKGNIEHVDKGSENMDPDWRCAYCGAMNSAKKNICEGCGASKNSSGEDYFSNDVDDDGIGISDARDVSDGVRESEIKRPAPDAGENRDMAAISPFRRFFNKRRVIGLGAAAAAIGFIVWLCVFLFVPVEGHMLISDMSWSRDIYIEELRTFDESGWNLPSGARLSYTREEIRSYDKVFDHYETRTRTVTDQVPDGYHDEIVGYRDLGNGQFEEITRQVQDYKTVTRTETYREAIYRDEPVYNTKYYYEIDRYVEGRDIATGAHDKSPYWGEVILGDLEREGRRAERYLIAGRSDGESEIREYSLDYSDWTGLNIGDEISFTYRRAGHEIISFDLDFDGAGDAVA